MSKFASKYWKGFRLHEATADGDTKESTEIYYPRENPEFPRYEGIIDIAIRYEHGDYDDTWAKAYQKHLTAYYAEFFSECTSADIKAIIKKDLICFKKCNLNMDDRYHSHKEQNAMYGHWYVLEWIYNRWAPEQRAPWHEEHLKIIVESREQTCETVVERLLEDLGG
jgi:hypothetical protein